MRQCAKSIKLVYDDATYSFLIDGEEFPWQVLGGDLAPRCEPVDYSHIPGLTITIPADAVQILHRMPISKGDGVQIIKNAHGPDGSISRNLP